MPQCSEPPDLICANPLCCLGDEEQRMQFGQLKRREFITLLGGAATSWPLAAQAQQAMPVIGVLGGPSAAEWKPRLEMFQKSLRDLGYVDGRNLGYEYRWADGQNDRLPALADELVRRRVSVIYA